MKKLVAILMAVLMLVGIVACNTKPADKPAEQKPAADGNKKPTSPAPVQQTEESGVNVGVIIGIVAAVVVIAAVVVVVLKKKKK